MKYDKAKVDATKFKVGQVLNFDYDLPDRYWKQNRGRKNGNFEIIDICENPVVKEAELLIYMKPLDKHFFEEYPALNKIWQHEDLLLKRISESKNSITLDEIEAENMEYGADEEDLEP